MSKRCMITGAGGSIGIHMLARFLRNTDWDIIAIDSFRHKGWSDRIVNHLKNHPGDEKRIEVITHDLSAPFSEMTKKKIGKVDYIVHLASLSDVEASIHEPVYFIENNVMLTLYLLEYAREVKPEAFVLFSTDEVYGPTPDKDTKYDEWSPLVPSNPYAASKAMQEMEAIAYWRTYGVPLIITNTMNNFGEMQQSSKYPVMIQRWLKSGEKITVHGQNGDIGSRSYIHSGNAAMAVLYILKNFPPHMHVPNSADKPDRYNIAGDKQIDNLELVHIIAKHMGKEPKIEMVDVHTLRPGHDRHYGLTNTKLKNLGFEPPVSFEESIANTIKWQEEHPEWIS